MSEPRITLEKLIILRTGVSEAYLKITDEDELPIANTQDCEFFESLRDLIHDKTGVKKSKVPGGETFRKFFYDDKYLNYSLATLKTLKDFVRACNLKPSTESYKKNNSLGHKNNEDNLSFAGAEFINYTFKNSMLSQNQSFTPTDFYTAKHNNGCQWYGIVNGDGWDAKRRDYNKIKDKVLKSFQRIPNCKISVVLRGAGGSGKSTVLRRLAIDCISDDLTILWIVDLNAFNSNIEIIKCDITKNYLIIIENWDKISDFGAKTFLVATSKLNNVRIVIGDRDNVEKRAYFEYFDESNTFVLLPNENKKILQKVMAINRKWKNTANKFLKSQLYESPLYLILFVLARTYAQKNNEISFGKDGIREQFKSIVIYDQTRILNVYPGLALALYYWACMNEECNNNVELVTWEALLILADYYNGGGNKISRRFSQLNKEDPIGEILSHYFSLEGFVNPELSNLHFFYLHHGLLGTDGLCNLISEKWQPFDDQVKQEILEILIESGEVTSSSYLYACRNYKKNDFRNPRLNDIVSKFNWEDELHFKSNFDGILKMFYRHAKVTTGEAFWEDRLRDLMIFMYESVFQKKTIHIILKTIIENGCKARCIKNAYDNILLEKLYLFETITAYFDKENLEEIRQKFKNML